MGRQAYQHGEKLSLSSSGPCLLCPHANIGLRHRSLMKACVDGIRSLMCVDQGSMHMHIHMHVVHQQHGARAYATELLINTDMVVVFQIEREHVNNTARAPAPANKYKAVRRLHQAKLSHSNRVLTARMGACMSGTA